MGENKIRLNPQAGKRNNGFWCEEGRGKVDRYCRARKGREEKGGKEWGSRDQSDRHHRGAGLIIYVSVMMPPQRQLDEMTLNFCDCGGRQRTPDGTTAIGWMELMN